MSQMSKPSLLPEKIRAIILESSFPKELEKDILAAYQMLAKGRKIWP